MRSFKEALNEIRNADTGNANELAWGAKQVLIIKNV